MQVPYSAIFQVVPAGEDHVTWDECPCGPAKRPLPTGGFMLLHWAFDGREAYEMESQF